LPIHWTNHFEGGGGGFHPVFVFFHFGGKKEAGKESEIVTFPSSSSFEGRKKVGDQRVVPPSSPPLLRKKGTGSPLFFPLLLFSSLLEGEVGYSVSTISHGEGEDDEMEGKLQPRFPLERRAGKRDS